MKRTTWIAVLSIATALTLGGCSDDDSGAAPESTTTTQAPATAIADRIPSPFVDAAQLPGTYVGAVENSDAFIAVVVDGSEATAFVCDGGDMWSWLSGTVTDGTLALTGPNGATLAGTVTDTAITGQFSGLGLNGNPFQAAPAASGEGVYRTVMDLNGENYTLGWIMTSEGIRGNMRNSAGQSANGVSADSDRDDRRRQERQEERRCDDLAQALARALATQDFLRSQPVGGANPQAIALNEQEIRRLQAVQC